MSTPRKRLGESNDPRLEGQAGDQTSRIFPGVPTPMPDNLLEVAESLKQIVETLVGVRGDERLNSVLVEDLEALGLISLWDNGFAEIKQIARFKQGTYIFSSVGTNTTTENLTIAKHDFNSNDVIFGCAVSGSSNTEVSATIGVAGYRANATAGGITTRPALSADPAFNKIGIAVTNGPTDIQDITVRWWVIK